MKRYRQAEARLRAFNKTRRVPVGEVIAYMLGLWLF